MSDFIWRHFEGVVILWAVRWLLQVWDQRYAPEMEKRLRWYQKQPGILHSWRLDETEVKVKGKWAYLYRAVDKDGDTIDFYLSATRNAKAVKRFLGKALNGLKDRQTPLKINTDKAASYGLAVAELKRQGKRPEAMLHRQL